MLTLKNLSGQRTIQVTLFSGIAMIVISMLFMGRGQDSASFIEQAISVLAAPAIFYLIGVLVYRYLNAPLAAPAIIATGAWLVGVGVIHLYVKRTLMPEALQPYYWLAASLAAAVLITVTGHRVQSWLIVPLVPLAQANALWATFLSLNIDVRWMPALTFVLVLLWWELPRPFYRGSAVILAALLMIFTIWLPATTSQSLMVTWGACAAVVAIVAVQNGWLSLEPLAIVILTGASMWGLPSSWWPITWLAFAVGTIVFAERRAHWGEAASRAAELSRALAVLLSTSAALLAQAAPLLGINIHPLVVVGVLASAGILLVWLGLQRQLLTATHSGLWLLAAAWIDLYYVIVPSSGLHGLWLALFAACALLVQRLAISRRKDKGKHQKTILETITGWPVADLAIGLSTIVLLWTVFQIGLVDTGILTITFAVIIGIWMATGLLYRLPVLLHIALWVLPIPYAMLMLMLAPAFWTLPFLGVAWQLLGAGLLILGHISPRYRPQILAPFFIVGYFLLGFGFIIANGNPALLPVSLTMIVIASTGTSAAVILGYHPAWSVFVEWLIQPEARPYAYRHVHHLFLFLAAWITAIWLHLLLGYADLSLPRQGICLVLFSCFWFIAARLLSRMDKVIVWPVIGAGWVLWLGGLLLVFYSPTEAIVTVVLGLAISAESLRRTRDVFWLPVLIVQVLFTALQMAWLLTLPGYLVLLLATVTISVAGMLSESRAPQAGRAAAITGGMAALGVWWFYANMNTTLLLAVLPIVAAFAYRNWKWLWLAYTGVFIATFQSGIHLSWQGLFIAGAAQWIVGAELLRVLRPRKFRTFKRAFSLETDWATPFLWVGSLCVFIALLVSIGGANNDVVAASVMSAALFAFYTFRLRILRLAYFSLVPIGFGFLIAGTNSIASRFLPPDPNILLWLSIGTTLTAIIIRWLCITAITYRVSWTALWLRPLLASTYVLCGVSAFLLIACTGRNVNSLELIANGVLLEVFTLMLYDHTRDVKLLWVAVGTAAFSWLLLLQYAGLNALAWKTLPLGAALFMLSRASQQKTLEYAGSLVWLVGCGLSLDRLHLLSFGLLGGLLHLVALLGYGYFAGKRAPFVCGLVILLGGIVYAIVLINPWLIPFVGGSLLLGVSLLIEVRHDIAERWLSKGLVFWQQWN